MNTNEYEVVVVGGGTSGAVAGIAASRQGAKTLIIEDYGFLGGTATAGLVTPWMKNEASSIPLNQGIAHEIKARLQDVGACGPSPYQDSFFDPEMLKFVLEDLALEAKAHLLYYSRMIDVVLEGTTLKAVLVHNKAGMQRISGKVFIDATGDGDVAARAQVPFSCGRASDGMKQALSLRFILGGVDLSVLTRFLESLGNRKLDPKYLHDAMVWGENYPLEGIFRHAVEEGVLQDEDGDYFQFFSLPGRPTELAFNCPRISEDVDALNGRHLTLAQIKGKQTLLRYLNFCRTYLPGCERAFLSQLAPLVGIRESRRVHGEYELTLSDILSAKKFPDGICRNHYPADIHVPRGKKGKGLLQSSAGHPYEDQAEYHEIPYRCLVPLSVEGLLVTGRCISASFEAQSSIRIQPNCHSLGEAAGVAAALCVQENTLPRQLRGTRLRDHLQKTGCYL